MLPLIALVQLVLAAPPFGGVDGYLRALNAVPDPQRIAQWHELLGSEPHIAGTEGDARQVERLRAAFVAMGLQVSVQEFECMLPQPQDAVVEIVMRGESAGPASPGPGARRGVIPLSIRERNLAEDPAAQHPGLTAGWNAFSGSGDVTAPVVYANYGTKQDFQKLKEWGIDCRGKVVLARYGGNFRGYKAKFAEDAGAAALVIFTDPADAGEKKGKTWPEGGWANDTCIQRGSILALEWPGDPETPGEPAEPGAAADGRPALALPSIPVQPIGYGAATQILSRMTGKAVPEGSGFSGGIPAQYRLEGGPDLQLRVKVIQDRARRRSANVVAILPGAVHPEQWVIVGCHHDAWCFGAADPLAGTIALMESARSFAEAAARGERPDRTVVFAAWGAEEYGIIGSVEWAEGHRERLLRSGVAYINLDMAAMGPNFGAACSPSLGEAIRSATVRVPQARGAAGEMVYDRISGGGRKDPQFGDLGGGSDHIAFNCHLGIASASLGSGGSEGNSYHSNYDTIAWYRSTVGADYAPALMITRMTNALAGMLADSPVVPLSAARHGREAQRMLQPLRDRAKAPELVAAIEPLQARAAALSQSGAQLDAALASAMATLGASDRERLDRLLVSLDRAWLDPRGLEGRPWFRSMLAASDRDSGYAATMLPLLAEALDAGDAARVQAAAARYGEVFTRLEKAIADAQSVVQAASTPSGPPAPLGTR
jgi:N-acetylated-alpha-linked acidic dipeptidase